MSIIEAIKRIYYSISNVKFKRAYFCFIAFVMASYAFAQNPICPPGLNIADPTARVWKDGKIYVYGSRDDDPQRYCSHDHWVLSSSDLINWTYSPDAFNSNGPKDKVPYNDRVLYAPDCIYKDSIYYLYYCQPGRDGTNEGVATSLNPTGPFDNAQLMNIPARFSQIDPTIFIDDDACLPDGQGQAYYSWGQFSAKIAKMKPNSMTEIDTSTIIDGVITDKEHQFHEGNFIIKRNGIYYMVYAHNGQYEIADDGRRSRHPTCIGYSTSTNPMGPYTYGGVIIDNKGCNPGNHNNHGSIVEFNGQWYVFYHRSTHGSKMMRKACLEPIFFNEDGSIDEVEMTTQGAGDPLNAFSKIEAEQTCYLNGNVRVETYSFDSNNLLNPSNVDHLTKIFNGDNAAFNYINFDKNAKSVSVQVAPGAKAGKIEVKIDSLQGQSIAVIDIPGSSDGKIWKTITADIKKTKGIHAVYLVFSAVNEEAFSLDWFKFNKL